MTKAEVYNAALRKIGVLGAGETAEAADTALCAEAYTEICAELGVGNASPRAGTGLHFANMVAADLMNDFQIGQTDTVRAQLLLSQRRVSAANILRIYADSYDTDTVTEAEFF